jgi:hypothetical protein
MPMPFRFGVQLHSLDPNTWIEDARRIETLGYSSALWPDHFGSQWDPTTAIASVAAVTRTLRVGTLVYGVDYRHPVVLAKAAATLQLLSGGRCEFGIGAGWMEEDYRQAGMPYDRPGIRIERLEEALKDAIDKLKTNLYGPSRTELTPTEIAMLERASVDLDEHPEHQDPMLTYATEFAAILATSLTPVAVGERLKVTPVRVRQLIRQHALFAIRVDSRWQVPIFQFDGDVLVPNIGRVNARLAELDAVSVMRWYTEKDPELEDSNGRIMTPLEWLKAGRGVEELIKIAPES